MTVQLDGQSVVVTGAGGGLGRSYALLLAERGAHVVVNDLGSRTDGSGTGSSAADSVVQEIRAAGGTAVASYDSVSTAAGARAIVETAMDSFGRLDAVVNNAGILRDAALLKMTEDDLDAVLSVHLRGTMLVSQAAFAVMKQAGYGRFVHTSSVSGLFGNFGQANYAAAKMGVVGLSRVIAEEGARCGVASNVLAPGARTRMTENLLGPLAAMLDPAKVAPVVAYLCSPQCELNREILNVSGGRVSRVVIGATPGWFAGANAVPTPDDIADNLTQIMSLDGMVVPERASDDLATLIPLLDSSARERDPRG